MKILLTGSSGFLGQHYLKFLRQQGCDVIGVDLALGHDLCDRDFVVSLPDVDRVVHLAARTGTKYFYSDPWNVVRNNLLPTQYLLERYADRVELFVHAGTCESYAGSVDLGIAPIPTPEHVPLIVTDVKNPRWSYGGSKLANEVQVHAAHQYFGMPFQILRFHNVYGPGQIDHFIPEFAQKLRQGQRDVQGGDQTRAFCYVSDVVIAAWQLMSESSAHNQTIHVGTDQESVISDVAYLLAKKLGIKDKLNIVPAPSGSVARRCPDLSLMHRFISWRPQIDLDQGIDLVLDGL